MFTEEEIGTTCCFATQDKVWVTGSRRREMGNLHRARRLGDLRRGPGLLGSGARATPATARRFRQRCGVLLTAVTARAPASRWPAVCSPSSPARRCSSRSLSVPASLPRQLSPDDVGLQLLENSIATALGLGVLILTFGPVSGAHFNPRCFPGRLAAGATSGPVIDGRTVWLYTVVQVPGAIVGALLANVDVRSSGAGNRHQERSPAGHLLGEIVATAGLIAVIFALARTGRAALSGRGRRCLHRRGLLVHQFHLVRQPCRHRRPDVLRHLRRHRTQSLCRRSSPPRSSARWSASPLIVYLYPDAGRTADQVVIAHPASAAPNTYRRSRHDQTRCPLPLYPQRRPIPDGHGLLQAPRRRSGASTRAVPNPPPRSTPQPSRRWPKRHRHRDRTAQTLDTDMLEAADVVVTMGCGDSCPVLPGRRYDEWVLPDPAGKSLDAVRPIRDEIEQRVRKLLAELGVDAQDRGGRE